MSARSDTRPLGPGAPAIASVVAIEDEPHRRIVVLSWSRQCTCMYCCADRAAGGYGTAVVENCIILGEVVLN